MERNNYSCLFYLLLYLFIHMSNIHMSSIPFFGYPFFAKNGERDWKPCKNLSLKGSIVSSPAEGGAEWEIQNLRENSLNEVNKDRRGYLLILQIASCRRFPVEYTWPKLASCGTRFQTLDPNRLIYPPRILLNMIKWPRMKKNMYQAGWWSCPGIIPAYGINGD